MHCGKKWRIREFVAPYIFPLNPDYVAARSLRSLPSNKLTKDKFAEPAQACCKLLVSRLSQRSQQAVAATKPKIGEPKILHSILHEPVSDDIHFLFPISNLAS